MPGMSSGLQTNNPTIVSAFKSLLLHEGLIILVILALLAVAWNVLRARPAAKGGCRTARPSRPGAIPSPPRGGSSGSPSG